MSIKVTVKTTGLKEVQTALRRLPDSTAKGVMRRVLKKVGRPVAEAARKRVPEESGELKDSINVSTRLTKTQRKKHKKTSKDDVEVYIGPGPLPQAHLQEFGTRNHKAQPFMRPAWDEKKMQVFESIKGEMWEEIKKTVARRAKKAAKA